MDKPYFDIHLCFLPKPTATYVVVMPLLPYSKSINAEFHANYHERILPHRDNLERTGMSRQSSNRESRYGSVSSSLTPSPVYNHTERRFTVCGVRTPTIAGGLDSTSSFSKMCKYRQPITTINASSPIYLA
jgi:hypothetical protein